MKTIFEPTVYLVGKQVIAQEGLTQFLEDHDFQNWQTDSPCDAETLVEVAARNCYQSFKGGRNHADHIHNLLEIQHGSCIEHAVWNLLVVGISRSLSHELVRHRMGISPSQLSQRYVPEDVAEYIVPPDLQLEVRAAQFRSTCSAYAVCRTVLDTTLEFGDMSVDDFNDLADAGVIWLQAVQQSQSAYVWLSGHLAKKVKQERPDLSKTEARKYARQAARSVLPNATETKIFLTANARALRHFIELRASRHADPEIRDLAVGIWKVMVKAAPNLFQDYQEVVLPDGSIELTTKHRKV